MNIGLLGPFGSGNLGDAAIQDAVIHYVQRRWPEATIYALSLNPADTEARHAVQTFPLSLASRRRPTERVPALPAWATGLVERLQRLPLLGRVVRSSRSLAGQVWCLGEALGTVRRLDTLVISGGGQLDDYWGGAWGHPYELFKWTGLAKLAGRRVVVLSVGAAEISSRLSRFFFRRALRAADYRSYRDTKSRDRVEALGLQGEHHVYPDLAYSLPVEAHRPPPGRRDPTRLVVGLSPIAAEAWTSPDNPDYRRYVDGMVEIGLHLLDGGDRIVFFPSQVRMDAAIIEEIAGQLRRQRPEAGPRISVRPVETVDDLLGAIATVDVVIGARLHGVLLSTLLHRPTLALAYHYKVTLLMTELGMPDYCLEMAAFTPGLGLAALARLRDHYDDVQGALRHRVGEFAEALERQYHTIWDGAAHGPG